MENEVKMSYQELKNQICDILNRYANENHCMIFVEASAYGKCADNRVDIKFEMH